MTLQEAWEFVLNEREERRFIFGYHLMPGAKLNEEIKRFIVEMYEKASGNILLDSKE